MIQPTPVPPAEPRTDSPLSPSSSLDELAESVIRSADLLLVSLGALVEGDDTFSRTHPKDGRILELLTPRGLQLAASARDIAERGYAETDGLSGHSRDHDVNTLARQAGDAFALTRAGLSEVLSRTHEHYPVVWGLQTLLRGLVATAEAATNAGSESN